MSVKALYISIIIIFQLSSLARANECTVECMICDAINDESQYAVGVMKSMKKIAPGKDKWLFRSDVDLTNTFGIQPNFRPELKRLISAFNSKGTQVVFIVQPTRGLMHRDKILESYSHNFNYDTAFYNFKEFLHQLKSSGAIVPDITPLISNPPSDFFFRRDHHWTPLGSRAIAQIVGESLIKTIDFSEFTRFKYTTEPSIIISKDGTMNRALLKMCGNNYGMQFIQAYNTYPKSSDNDDNALFGDNESTTDAVLIGTSNSATRDDDFKNYNFEGFLREYLKVDIVNYALPGSGQEGSLLHYVLSDDYDHNNSPKLLLWELPASYNLSDDKIYRQIIPAINGGCDSTNKIMNKNTAITQPLIKDMRFEVLTNASKNRSTLTSSRYFLQLDFSNKSFKDFYVLVYYDSGRRDKVWFRRHNIVDGGRFFLELSKSPDLAKENLLSILIQPTEDYDNGTHVEATLCENH